MFRIRRFGIIRTANVAALLYAIIILIVFIPVTLIVAIAGPSIPTAEDSTLGSGGALFVLFLGMVIAIVYAIVGWIFTAIACALYNFVAGLTGGIEVQVEAAPPSTSVAPTWGPPASAPPAPPASSSPPSGG